MRYIPLAAALTFLACTTQPKPPQIPVVNIESTKEKRSLYEMPTKYYEEAPSKNSLDYLSNKLLKMMDEREATHIYLTSFSTNLLNSGKNQYKDKYKVTFREFGQELELNVACPNQKDYYHSLFTHYNSFSQKFTSFEHCNPICRGIELDETLKYLITKLNKIGLKTAIKHFNTLEHGFFKDVLISNKNIDSPELVQTCDILFQYIENNQ